MTIWRSIFGFVFLASFVNDTLLAQSQPLQPDFKSVRGFSPNGVYQVSGQDSVDPVSGNLIYQIPITALPPGRAGFNWGLKLVYNSHIFDQDPSNVFVQQGGGWGYDAGQYSLEEELLPSLCQGNVFIAPSHRMVLIFPDGSHHTLHLYNDSLDKGDGFSYTDGFAGTHDPPSCGPTSTPSSTPLTYHTSDGTFVKVVLTPAPAGYNYNYANWVAYLQDGSVVQASGLTSNSITDRNGNKIFAGNFYGPGGLQTGSVLQDDLGRTIYIFYNATGTSHSYDTIVQTGSGSVQLTWTVNWRTVPASAFQYDCGFACTAGVPNSFAVSSMVLPSVDGSVQQFQFGYDTDSSPLGGWGQLNLVIPPTAPTTCTASNLGSSCPRFTYTYAQCSNGCVSPAEAPGEYAVTQKKQIWFEDQTNTQRTDMWTYSGLGTYGGPSQTVNPDGGTVSTYYNYISPDQPLGGLVYKIVRPDKSTVERVWLQNKPFTSGQYDPANPYIKTEYRSASDGASPQLASAKDYTYDKNGNVTNVDEYDWAAYSSPLTLTGQKLRTTKRTYTSPTPAATNSGDITNAYWNPSSNPSPSTSPMLLSLLRRSEVDDLAGGGPGSVAEFGYDSKGNILNKYDWDSTKSSMPALGLLSSSNSSWHHFIYDGNGNVKDATDPLCTTTKYFYDSNNLYKTSIVEDYRGDSVGCTPPTAFLTRTTAVSAEFATGLELQRTDYNNLVRSSIYDALGRPTFVSEQNGSTLVIFRGTAVYYSDANRRITTCSDLTSFGDRVTMRVSQYDQLGRLSRTGQLESAGSSYSCPDTAPAGILTDTRYMNSSGASYQLVSNPYESASDPTMGWTLTTSDQNGRVTGVSSFTGNAAPSPWGTGTNANTSSTGTATTAYGVNVTGGVATQTVTDQAGVARTLSFDGLGRLSSVTEAGPAITSYGHDALDSLTSVTQSGVSNAQCTTGSRCFTFDSLKRLSSANNPESGLISYLYDASGNLTSKTDTRFTTTNGIDTLGRVVSKTYTDPATPTVNYCYDGQTWNGTKCSGTPVAPAIGRLTQMISSVSSNSFTYDVPGRVMASVQTTGGTSFNFQYGYNAANLLTSETYPSGRTVSYVYDPVGRPTTVNGQVSGIQTATYASSISYAPQGGLQQLTLGNNLIEQTCYNARLRPVGIRLGTGTTTNCANSSDLLNLGYDYGTSDNGNLQSQTIQVPGIASMTQNYGYDKLNRLTVAGENASNPSDCATGTSAWCQKYGYDAPGNWWISYQSGLAALTNETAQSQSWYNGSSNQISGWTYDRGNVTAITNMSRIFQYDAENRMTQATINGQVAAYGYDGEGRRVTKTANGTTTTYVYDAAGQLSAEYGLDSQTRTGFLTADHLGSTRLETDPQGNVLTRYDYLPFGGELWAGSGLRSTGLGYRPVQALWTPSDPRKLFTGKERDAETGLDYFGARYMSGAQGRWTSPDAINVTDERILNPSNTLNKYIYGGNNPLKFVDPDGEDITVYYTNGGIAGHTMMMAYNQATGDSAVQSFGPASHSAASEAEMGIGIGVQGTANYDFSNINSADQLRQDYASITIQTSPEETQKVIQYIRTHSDGDYKTYSNNCTTTCAKILRTLSLYKKDSITPKGFFTDLLHQYGATKSVPNTIQHGMDYGKPRSGFDAFGLLFLSIQNQESAAKKPKEVVKTKICYTDDHGKQQCDSGN